MQVPPDLFGNMIEANLLNSLLANKLIITQLLADFAGELVSSCSQCLGNAFSHETVPVSQPCQASWGRYANNSMLFSQINYQENFKGK